MALSQDEQRMLAEIERRLAADDPGLASCLTTFRRPGPGTVLRSPRARIIGSLFTVLLVAMVSLMVYAMVPFRGQVGRHLLPTAGASANTPAAAVTSSEPNRAQLSSAAAGNKSTASQTAAARTAPAAATSATSATVKAQSGPAKATNEQIIPEAGPS
jgi:hypothetical protein